MLFRPASLQVLVLELEASFSLFTALGESGGEEESWQTEPPSEVAKEKMIGGEGTEEGSSTIEASM